MSNSAKASCIAFSFSHQSMPFHLEILVRVFICLYVFKQETLIVHFICLTLSLFMSFIIYVFIYLFAEESLKTQLHHTIGVQIVALICS